MIDLKIIKVFEDVLSKTKDGKISWEPTAQGGSFIAAIGGQFSLSISAQADVESTFAASLLGGSPEKYTLVLRDMHERIATVTDRDEGIRAGAMRELYETVRWQALHGGEKINRALEVLKSL
jgi:hypothetical protein